MAKVRKLIVVITLFVFLFSLFQLGKVFGDSVPFIISNFPEAKLASQNREIIVRCRSCGDSKDITHGHMYIHIPQDKDDCPVYHCFKCQISGVVNSKTLIEWGIYNPEIAIETDKLMLHMILMEGSQKKIFCSLYDIELLRHIKVLSLYDTTEEIFQQICDYLDINKQLNIKSSIIIHANKVELIIPINSKKYKQLNFELKYENSELVEILLDTVDNLMKKNEEFEKRITALEEKVFGIKKNENETKNEDNEFKGKIENLTNTKTIKPHGEYISNIILLQNGKIASSSLDHYIKIYNKDTFEEEISIKENSYVDWIEQIKDGILISCPRDNTIRLYEINDIS